jgi:hypothetical protein
MNTPNDPLIRLQRHAGLPVPDLEVPKDTLAEFIFQIQRGRQSRDLFNIADEIIQCLEVLNRQMNQEAAMESRQAIGRPLVYAVSGIVWACLNKAMELRRADPQSPIADDLLTTAWRIQCAWDALVAGDVENLPAHVASEERARVDS